MEETNELSFHSFDGLNSQDSIFSYQEYYLTYKNNIYKILVIRNQNEIIIQSNNYTITFNHNDLSILTQIKFESLGKAYDFIVDLFEENKARIENISAKYNIKLILRENLEFSLLYSKNTKEIFIEKINSLQKEVINLRDNNQKLFYELDNLRNLNNNDPKKIEVSKNITKEAYAYTDLVNSFSVFKSLDEILYLIYATKEKSIICYDLEGQKTIKEIKNKHNEFITNLIHYLDNINKRDLVMSISLIDSNINIWNAGNWELVINIPNAYESGYLYSGCFLKDKNQNYIITSNYKGNKPIIVFDFNRQKIKELNDSSENTFFVSVYFDEILEKNYIVTGNMDSVISYDYEKNELYHVYKEYGLKGHPEVIIKKNEPIIKLIESCGDGIVRIWNFHSGEKLSEIIVSEGKTLNPLNGMCLWNNNYLFVTNGKTIKLIELNNGLNVKSLSGHNNTVFTIKKIYLSQYGECLISQGWEEDQIKIWTPNNN